MPEIGIRELKAKASDVIRQVRERRARYVVTYRGKPVAAVIPLEGPPGIDRESSGHRAWDQLTELGAEIGETWRSPRTSLELLSEARR